MLTTPQIEDGVIVAPPGLKNVVVADTTIGEVRGDEGFFHYREYDAARLAVDATFEDCWYLLFEGRLPDATGSAAFAAEIAGLRALPDEVTSILPVIAGTGSDRASMTRLRTALSQLGSAGTSDDPDRFGAVWGADPAAVRADAMRICAVVPVVQAAMHRLRQGREPVAPDPSLSTGANWLRMITGETPSVEHERAINTYLGLTIEHGFNASTFTARVVTSTGSDVASAVCAAIGSFAGPLHGGAPDRALDGLDEIGSVDNAAPWVRKQLESGDRVMGFGHGVYTTDDPRALVMRDVAQQLGGPLADLAIGAEAEIVRTLEELKPGRHLHVNVEYYAGVVMAQCGIPRELFTPTFAVARVVGWCAHILEQARATKIFRPKARYTGPEPQRR